jgi:hypothetical protein
MLTKLRKQNDSARNESRANNEGARERVYSAALRVTAPLLPSVAMAVTVVVYLASDEISKAIGVSLSRDLYGDSAILIGIFASVLI